MGLSITIVAVLAVTMAGALLGAWRFRPRKVGPWLGAYVATASRRHLPTAGEDVHLLLCIADHWEPRSYGATPAQAAARVRRWTREYPRLFGGFHDSDGRSPRHTFFYPADEYDPRHADALAALCARGHGEVEIHLHHDQDTSLGLRSTLLQFKQLLHERHGLLSRRRHTGESTYGFVHGNWALDNSHPEGRCCGVNDELNVLRETGCYADFTMPSAPDATQVRKINSIYYAVDDPHRPRSHETGIDVGAAPPPRDGLLMIQGPLLLDWRNKKWRFCPRIENGCIQPSQPPSLDRLRLWLKARVQVPSRPDWFFVKLHAHGATEEHADVLLGEPMVRFHQMLRDLAANNPRFHFHYVTARETYNLVRAAEAGWTDSVDAARDFELVAYQAARVGAMH